MANVTQSVNEIIEKAAAKTTPPQNVADQISRLNGLADSNATPGYRFSGINAPARFVKACSLLGEEGFTPIVKATVTLPTLSDDKFSDIEIFEIPYNHVQSFAYTPYGGDAQSTTTAELKISDATGYIGDLLVQRFHMMAMSPYFNGSPRIKIEFGWSRPQRKYNKIVEQSVFFTQHIDAIVMNVKPEFGDSINSYTIELNADPVSGYLGAAGDLFRPYMKLGPWPLVNFMIEQLIKDILALEGDPALEKYVNLPADLTKDAATAAEYSIVSSSSRMGKMLTDLTDKYGLVHPKDRHDLMTRIHVFFNSSDNKNLAKSLENSKLAASSSFNDKGEDSQSVSPGDNEDTFTKLKKHLEPVIRKFLPYLTEQKIHPWVAFGYLYKSMREQMASLRDTIKTNPKLNIELAALIMVDESTIEGLSGSDFDSEYVKKIIANEKIVRDLNATKENTEAAQKQLNDLSFIKVNSLNCSITDDWQRLINEVLKKVKLKDRTDIPNSQAGPQQPVERAISFTSFFGPFSDDGDSTMPGNKPDTRPASDELSAAIDTAVSSIDGLKNKQLFKVLYRVASLPFIKVQDGSQPPLSDNLSAVGKKNMDKVKSLAEKVTDAAAAGKKGVYYIIITPEAASTIFGDKNWENSVVNTYTVRPKKMADSEVFFSGRRLMTEGFFPDVLACSYEFDYFNQMRASFGNMAETRYVNGSLQVDDSELLAGQIEERLKAQEKHRKERIAAVLQERLKRKPTEAEINQAYAPLQINEKGAIGAGSSSNLPPGAKEVFDEEKNDEARKKQLLSLRNQYPVYVNLDFGKQYHPIGNLQSDDAVLAKKNMRNFRRRMALEANDKTVDLTIVGEPAYDFVLLGSMSGAQVLLNVFNPDGSESMFSGMYRIETCTHEIQGSRFETKLKLKPSSYGSDQDPYGYAAFLEGRDKLKPRVD